MAAETQTLPLARISLIAASAVLLYLAAFFPVMSYIARNPDRDRLLELWLPLPAFARLQLYDVWEKFDPDGAVRWQLHLVTW